MYTRLRNHAPLPETFLEQYDFNPMQLTATSDFAAVTFLGRRNQLINICTTVFMGAHDLAVTSAARTRMFCALIDKSNIHLKTVLTETTARAPLPPNLR